MKILKRNEVLAETNKRRQEQIDEGMNIARKVDALRSTLADLQKKHSDFIAGMKAAVEKEISPLVKLRDELKLEVSRAKAALADLRVPLDAEWAAVRSERQRLDDDIKDSSKREALIVETERELEKQQVQLEEDRKSIDDLKKDALHKLTEVDETLTEAEHIVHKATTDANKITALLVERERDVERKENEVYLKSVDNKNRAAHLDEKEAALNERERAVNDKYLTLERTISRLKK